MKWLAKTTVSGAMLIGMPTAACQVTHHWQETPRAAVAGEETTVRGDTFSTALPQNVDRSLERDVQVAQSTIRSEESIRSGGSSLGGGASPPPPPKTDGK